MDTQYALEATMDLLENITCCTYKISLEDILWLIEIVLQASILQYPGVLYRQKRGLAMDIRLAPTLATAFMNQS